MKKLIKIFVIMLVTLSLFGCADPRDTKAQVTDKNGNKTELSANEIVELYEKDHKKFVDTYQLYGTAKISGTVEKIEGGSKLRTIYLKEGWKICVSSTEHPETELLVEGDKIVAKGGMQLPGKDKYMEIGIISQYRDAPYNDDVELRILD